MTLIDELPRPNPKANVFNRQRKIRLDPEPLRVFADELSLRLGMTDGFSVVLISDQAMRRLNRRFAGKDRTTDVLSFPFRREAWEAEGEPYAGDVFISVETARRRRGAELMTELKVLTLHGVLHLLGYDHERDDGEMAALESRLKRKFQIH